MQEVMARHTFHWHMSIRYFRDHHILLDEQGEQSLR
jgi:DNA-binding ferritin-like protein